MKGNIMEFDQTIVNVKRWEINLRNGRKALADGDLDEAEKLLELALKEASQFNTRDPRTANIMSILAEVYSKQERYDKAAENYKNVIEILEETLGSDYEGLLEVLNKYAEARQNLDRSSEADGINQQIEAIREKLKD
jgi:tetratricopeptide (TPR) repeat protein